MLYKSDRLYDDAIRCFIQALKIDKDNLNVIRDLAQMQVHKRDFHGYTETRNRLLILRPQQKQNWIAFALGSYFCKDYETALKVLSNFENLWAAEVKRI